MTTDEVRRRLAAAFAAAISPSIEVRAELSAVDVEEWDSLAHVNFIFAVEEEFGIVLTQDEMAELANVGDLEAVICTRVGAVGEGS